VFVSPVFAQEEDTFGLQQIDDESVLVVTDIRVTIARIIRVALSFLGIIAVVLVLYAGFTIMTAGGNEENVTKGKKILMNAGIGLAIILSAWAITQFVITRLENATKGITVGDEEGVIKPGDINFQSYSGSGALGGIIKDHYPARDQIEIPRNASIVVTFNEPIDPESLIENTNDTCFNESEDKNKEGDEIVKCDGKNKVPYIGDCLQGDKECDKLKDGVVQIYRKDDKQETKVKGLGTAVYDKDRLVFDVVFDPQDPALLGELKGPIWYVVKLTSAVKKANKEGAFDNTASGEYLWEFQTGVNSDFTPPFVEGFYPLEGQEIPRNTIVQIIFSEPVHPGVGKGVLDKATSKFSNLVFQADNVIGEWKLNNGYTTAEFVPKESCGINSCGNELFCLPAPQPKTPYEVLVRTAELKNPGNNQSFDAKPFSGIQDMANNAMDGNEDGVAQGKPSVINKYKSDEKEKVADNKYWKFTVKDNIDLTSPHIVSVLPPLDDSNVEEDKPVVVTFSERMQFNSIPGNINIQEEPKAEGVDGLWVKYEMSNINEKTVATVKHRDFGPNGQDLFYFVSVSGEVLSMHGNCMYPGLGPFAKTKGAGPNCTVGKDGKTKGCVAVTTNKDKDTGCIITEGLESEYLQADVKSCLETMTKKLPK